MGMNDWYESIHSPVMSPAALSTSVEVAGLKMGTARGAMHAHCFKHVFVWWPIMALKRNTRDAIAFEGTQAEARRASFTDRCIYFTATDPRSTLV